jgi:hypothetical protein
MAGGIEPPAMTLMPVRLVPYDSSGQVYLLYLKDHLTPLQEMGVKEAHPERPNHRRRIHEKKRKLQIANVCKAVADPDPDNKAHPTRDACTNGREEPEELAFVESEQSCCHSLQRRLPGRTSQLGEDWHSGMPS